MAGGGGVSAQPTIKVLFHCGAFMMGRDPVRIHSGERMCVMDTDPASTSLRPKFEDGKPAPCFLDCPVAKRKCGYKLERCFPSDDAKIGKEWRYVIECKVCAVIDTEEEVAP
jgi:hypothetical protein